MVCLEVDKAVPSASPNYFSCDFSPPQLDDAWFSCLVTGNWWGRGQIFDRHCWAAALCVSSGWLDPSITATVKVITTSMNIIIKKEKKKTSMNETCLFGCWWRGVFCCFISFFVLNMYWLLIVKFILHELPGMLDIHLASAKKQVHMVEILLEFSVFISLRKWSNSVLLAQMAMNRGTCMRKWLKTLRSFTRWYGAFIP